MTIREKIMAIEPKQKIENIYKAWFDVGKRVAVDIAEAEVQRLEARVRELEDFARFMCETWVEIDSFVRENCTGDEMMKYPVIQGTSNQVALMRIAEQKYDKGNIAKAVKRLAGGE